MEELREYVQKGVLSDIQVDILDRRLRGTSYDDIVDEFHLSGNQALTSCIIRTVQGRNWTPGTMSGKNAFLSHIDQHLFHEIVKEAADEINCITTHEAFTQAMLLKRSRHKIAIDLLIQSNSEKLIPRLDKQEEPSNHWLVNHCNRVGIIICRPQTLELARRLHCDTDVISKFFDDFGWLMEKDPRLLFNMDETNLNSNKFFKVLRTIDHLPLTIGLNKLPHLTGMITISAAGHVMKPVVILPKLKKIKSLLDFEDHCYFVTSSTGWVTKDLFFVFCTYFCAELSHYRMSLPDTIADETVLLIVDGHSSRYSIDSIALLAANNIDLLVLPPHTSHCLQPFDVAVASPLKTAFKKHINSSMKRAREMVPGKQDSPEKLTSEQLRYTLLSSFLTSLSQAATLNNCRAAFSATGIYPFNPGEPLSSHFAMSPLPAEVVNLRAKSNAGKAALLSSPAEMNIQCNKERNRNCTDDDLTPNVKDIIRRIRNNPINSGKIISRVPPIFQQMWNGSYNKININ